LHLAHAQRPGQLQQPVRERGFAMVDVGDDGKISDVLAIHAFNYKGNQKAPDALLSQKTGVETATEVALIVASHLQRAHMSPHQRATKTATAAPSSAAKSSFSQPPSSAPANGSSGNCSPSKETSTINRGSILG